MKNTTNFLPVPIIVAVLALLYMILSANQNLLAWVGFITWGAYFLTSINTRGAIREGISFTLGIVFGAVIVMLATALAPTLGTFAVPVAVAVAAFVIVYLEMVPWFDMAPGYFLGAAAFFAAGAKPDSATFMAIFIPGIIGLALGMITAFLRRKVFAMQGKKDPMLKKK